MPLPEISQQIIKIISLGFLTITTVIKFICLLILNGEMSSSCIAGWHVNEELSNYILLLCSALISDILMLLCIGAANFFKSSNYGADPGSIIYNFLVGLLTFSCLFTIFGIDDCKSGSLTKIKLVGIVAAIIGLLHIANGAICLIFLAPEERLATEIEQPTTSNARSNKNSAPKATTSKNTSSK